MALAQGQVRAVSRIRMRAWVTNRAGIVQDHRPQRLWLGHGHFGLILQAEQLQEGDQVGGDIRSQQPGLVPLVAVERQAPDADGLLLWAAGSRRCAGLPVCSRGQVLTRTLRDAAHSGRTRRPLCIVMHDGRDAAPRGTVQRL